MKNVNELFTEEELYEAFAQIERGEYYSIEEVEEELAKEFGDELPSGNDGIGKNKSA